MKKYITTNNLLIVLIILSSFNIFMNFRIFEEQASEYDVKRIREPLKKIHSIEKIIIELLNDGFIHLHSPKFLI